MGGSILSTLLSEPVLLPAGGAMAALFVVLSVIVVSLKKPGSVRLLLTIGGLAVLVLAAVFLLERMAESEQAAAACARPACACSGRASGGSRFDARLPRQ